MLYNINFFESNENKKVDRPIFSVKKDEVYNVIKFANPESNSLINIYSYLPNSEQLLENIPSCIEPTKKQAINYINAYDKIFMYLSSSKDYRSSKPEQIGVIAKAVLDYDYNYYNYKYFRDLLSLKIKGTKIFVQEAFNQSSINTYKNREPLPTILNKVFTRNEQKILAKEIYQLYQQSMSSCVQAGYGKDFYSIFWSGMPEQYSYENSSYAMQEILITSVDMILYKQGVIDSEYRDMFNILEKYSYNDFLKYSKFLVSKQLSEFKYFGGRIKLYGDLGYILSDKNKTDKYLIESILAGIQESNIFYLSFKITDHLKQNQSKSSLEKDCSELNFNENSEYKLLCKNRNLMCYVLNSAEYICDSKRDTKQTVVRMSDFNNFYR